MGGLFGGGGRRQQPPPPPPPPPATPTPADTSVVKAGERERTAAKSGIGATIATSGQGLLSSGQTEQRSLLGQ